MSNSIYGIVSQDFGILAKCLSAALQENTGTLKKQRIFVPHITFKQWLIVQLAKESPSGCIAGYQVCTIDELIYEQFPCMPTKLEMRCLIYQMLDTHLDKLELTRSLTDLFFLYGKYGFPKEGWQAQLITKILSANFLLPVQFLPEKEFFTQETCHFFGFNTLPPLYAYYMSQANGIFYLFSPCIHFWEDVRTSKEEARNFRKTGKADDLTTAPGLLANLGKLGREKFLDLEIEPAYAPTQTQTILGALQHEIVTFEKFEGEKKEDDSIQMFKTGASKFTEVETVGKEILRLCKEKGLSFSEISILAPVMLEYIPIVESIFSRLSIPYRFTQKPIQSAFYHGILRLIALLKGPWSAEKIRMLFETASFSSKLFLEEKELANWIQWVEKIFQFSKDWEQGFAEILKSATTIQPGPVQTIIPMSSFDSLEKLLEILQSLQTDLCSKNKTLQDWANQFERIAEKYLSPEEDRAAFDSSIRSLRRARLEAVEFPFEVIEELFTQGLQSSYLGNHLHAVCLSSIGEGAVTPSRACFLMGMDEESFPRKMQRTSLDLIRKDPATCDIDRYLFLQVLLNTKEALILSYSHISPEDGKSVNPSSVVQELLQLWPAQEKTILQTHFEEQKKRRFSFQVPKECECKESTISLTDLNAFARNPWKFYLQKVENIYLEERKERSFRALRSQFARSSLDFPIESVISARQERYPGIFQEAFSLDAQKKALEMQKQLSVWGKKKSSIIFYQTAKGAEFSPIRLSNANIVGEIPHCIEDGALHFGDDHISSLLKVWPEILAACVALESPKIYCLKTGKMKTIMQPKVALEKFVAYYLRCQRTLSPLIPDWANAILRKGEFSPKFEYTDEVHEWMLPRLDIQEHFLEEWKWLRESFSELMELFPKRE
ncbi:MAG TPA: exodeoxyribonuclease V subunit gamma [Chlamydiales bacterium]|nr:exodeoxyribonuclease V subunit gamma [Chlamydiales bacterium]